MDVIAPVEGERGGYPEEEDLYSLFWGFLGG